VTNVEDDIQTDYSTALQRHRRLVTDLVGFSRGAVIAATVASDLNTVNLTATGFVIQPGAPQHIDVHWVGLFDAVSMMGPGVNAPHNAWATTFSANIHAQAHLIHTATGWRHPGQAIYPTVMTFTPGGNPPTPYYLANNQASTHHNVGFDAAALQWMIQQAQAAGVPVR
jgi:hypothetical protein